MRLLNGGASSEPDDRGMTLIELIVVLAVASIIIAAAGSIILSSFSIFGNIARTNRDKLIGDSVYDYICDKVIFTYSLKIAGSQKILLDEDEKVLEITGGRLYFDGEDVYGSSFYDDISLHMNIEQYSTDSVRLTVGLMRGGKQTYGTEAVVRLLNYKFSAE